MNCWKTKLLQSPQFQKFWKKIRSLFSTTTRTLQKGIAEKKAISKMIVGYHGQNHLQRKKTYFIVWVETVETSRLLKRRTVLYETKERMGAAGTSTIRRWQHDNQAILKRKTDYKKRVTWIEKTSSTIGVICMDIAIVEYLGTFPSVYGNSKIGICSEYARTSTASTRKLVTELRTNLQEMYSVTWSNVIPWML